MKRNPTNDSVIAVVATPESERVVRWYAEVLTGRRNRRVRVIHEPTAAQAAIRQLARADTIGMIVSEWSASPSSMQTLLRLADELAVPAVFIRQHDLAPLERLVVATAGGPNVLELIWIAKKIAAASDIPVRILHRRQTTPAREARDSDPECPVPDGLAERILGMEAQVEPGSGKPLVPRIAACVRENDLLVLGAPSALRRAVSFADSVPDRVARTTAAPMVLLSSPPAIGVDLRRLFWGGLIETGARCRDKKDAIAGLIRNLALHNRLPRSSQADILDRALRREAAMSTAVDCETAFPHVTLRGFFGLAGAMAICPDGVEFGSLDGRPTRFLFLMITPDGLCEDYLPTLARIARRMVKPKVRQALLACKTSAQVLDILEPRNPSP